MRSIILVLVCVLGGSLRAAAQTVTIDLEGLVLSVSASRTAQIFHIVDQLSEWDQFTHKAFGRWARKSQLLDQAGRDLLKRHAELRKVHGWNSAFERAFYVDESIDTAARRAVESGALSREEAETEVAVLRHFDRGETITAFLPKAVEQWRRVPAALRADRQTRPARSRL